MAILMLGLAFSLGGLMFLARFERDAHDRKTAVAISLHSALDFEDADVGAQPRCRCGACGGSWREGWA